MPAPEVPLSPRSRRRSAKDTHPALILAVLATASFLATLDVWITNVGLPAIGGGVHAGSLSDLSWVLNGYGIVYAALLVPAGRLVDRYGRKGGFVIGMALFGVASLGAALSGDVWVLVGFRVLQAVGAAILTPSSLGLVLTTAPAEKVGQYIKIWFTSSALAAASGPVIGGLLVGLSWRWLFLVNIPIVLIATTLAVRLVPDVNHDQGTRLPDLLGGVLLVLGIGALNLGVVEGPDWGWGSARVVAVFAIAVVGLLAFGARSVRHAAPVVDLSLFRNRVFAASNVVALLSFGSFGIMLLSAILLMQGHWHYSAVTTGLATAPGPVMFATGSALAEMLQQNKGVPVRLIAGVGSLVAAVGMILITLSLHEAPNYLGGFLPFWMIYGIGLGAAAPLAISLAAADLPPAQAATGSAVVSMVVTIGSAIGVSVLVAILGPASSGAPLSTFQDAWLVAIGLSALAGCASLFIRLGKHQASG